MRLCPLPFVVICSLLAACQSVPERAGSPAAPVPALTPPPPAWVRTEIVFTVAPAEAEGMGLAIAEGAWRQFVDEEVTPRFPTGVSVVEGSGQWRADAKALVERERTKVLTLVHPATDAARADVAAILGAFERRFAEEGVEAVEYPVTILKTRAPVR